MCCALNPCKYNTDKAGDYKTIVVTSKVGVAPQKPYNKHTNEASMNKLIANTNAKHVAILASIVKNYKHDGVARLQLTLCPDSTHPFRALPIVIVKATANINPFIR